MAATWRGIRYLSIMLHRQGIRSWQRLKDLTSPNSLDPNIQRCRNLWHLATCQSATQGVIFEKYTSWDCEHLSGYSFCPRSNSWQSNTRSTQANYQTNIHDACYQTLYKSHITGRATTLGSQYQRGSKPNDPKMCNASLGRRCSTAIDVVQQQSHVCVWQIENRRAIVSPNSKRLVILATG